jgi:hypothetical protein
MILNHKGTKNTEKFNKGVSLCALRVFVVKLRF